MNNTDLIDVVIKYLVLGVTVIIIGMLILMTVFAILISVDEFKKMKQHKLDSKNNKTLEYNSKESEDSNNE